MDTADPFDTLALPPRVDLRDEDLRAAWLRRCAALHPDRAPAGGAMDEGERARVTAALNHAKHVLEDPERRADALLTRLGGPATSQDTSLPPDLLLEIMETRESLDEALRAGDRERVESLRRWALERRAGHVARVGDAFARAGDPPDGASLRAVRIELNAWRYIERMLERIDEPAAPG